MKNFMVVNFKYMIELICDVIIYYSLYMVDVYVFGLVLKSFCDVNDIDMFVIGDCVDGLLLK